MATLNNTLNVIACSQTTGIGTGTYGCLAKIKKAKHAWLVTAGYEFDGAVDFTDAYVQTKVADGTIAVLQNITAVDPANTENSYEDIGDGVKALQNRGLYEFNLKFKKGMHNNRILSSLSGDSSYDVLFVDQDDQLFGAESASGNLKGFTLGIHQAELMEGIISDNTAREVFKIQLTQTSELDSYAIVQSNDDFNASIAVPLNQIKLTFTSAPSNTDTSISVKAVRLQDGAAFTGVDYTDFLVKVNGTTTNPTAGDDSVTTGTYVLTGITALSTNDVIEVMLYDNANNRRGIYLDAIGYKSNPLTATVVA